MAYDVGSKRDLYEDWKPLFEWAEDAAAEDTEQEEEALMVEQTNGPRGTSAGGPADHGYVEPLWKKPLHPALLQFGDGDE